MPREGKRYWLEQLKPFRRRRSEWTGREPAGSRGADERAHFDAAHLAAAHSQRFRDYLRAEVARTVQTPAEIADELQYVLKLLVS